MVSNSTPSWWLAINLNRIGKYFAGSWSQLDDEGNFSN